MRLVGFMGLVVFSLTIACTTKEEKQEVLAKQYCGTCHSFPEPSLLSKNAWSTVMPQMAVRMGIDISPLTRLSEEDYLYVIQTLPKKPLISEQDFEAIMKYYEREAPDSLSLPDNFKAKEIDQFEITELKLLNQRPTISMLQVDTVKKRIWLSNRRLMLYEYDFNFKRIDSIQLTSPASGMVFNEEPLVALMGIMDPNDQPAGSIKLLKKDKSLQRAIDSLRRPVFIEQADLNNDKQNDIVVCEFGNYGGELSVHQGLGDGTFAKHTINALPGARKVTVRDFNTDGLADILVLFSQGDENISLYTNAGNFNFRVTTLLKFPPVYGSNFYDIADFNKDGHWDLIYTNGDNADYSKILKPYHGVRVFLNDGQNHFTESSFQQLYGCSMAFARDFDKDGDLDIITISFFPDFKRTPERGLVYLENNNGTFEAHTTPASVDGRWLLMEPADLDADGYLDIVLAALNFDDAIPDAIDEKWDQNPIDIMVLKNLSRRNRDKGKK